MTVIIRVGMKLLPEEKVTITPVGISCLVGWYYSMQGPIQGQTIDVFSLPSDCVASSNCIKANQQKGSFLVSLRLVLYVL